MSRMPAAARFWAQLQEFPLAGHGLGGNGQRQRLFVSFRAVRLPKVVLGSSLWLITSIIGLPAAVCEAAVKATVSKSRSILNICIYWVLHVLQH